MEAGVKTKILRIGGMTCVHCQNKIERKLKNTAGIKKAEVNYNDGSAIITYDTDIIKLKDIYGIIRGLDYEVLENSQTLSDGKHVIGILILVLALYMFAKHLGITELFNAFPLAEAGMGYGMLFIIGLVTSVHCIAMCGGINLSQCIPGAVRGESGKPFAALRPSLLYNFGRVVSYTVVGAIVGTLGSAISFTGTMKGIVQIAAGIFMVIMGINMLGLFPWLRKFSLRMPRIFAGKIESKKSENNSPLVVGLLNGLMPCGPLQAMQLYALSTGSPVKGALSMLIFSLGTVPLMFGLGALSSVMSKKFTRKVMRVGAVLVVILGLFMFSSGMSLSGFSGSVLGGTAGSGDASEVVIEDGTQVISSTLSSGKYPQITVQAGIPVKWIINAPEGTINGCNNRMIIPEYDIEYQFKTGENVIEFTPEETGNFSYSCWMGMIRGRITVVAEEAEAGQEEDYAENINTGSGCCAGGYSADFADGKIPTDNIQVAQEIEGVEQATVTVNEYGYSPAVIVVEKGKEFVINFVPEGINGCNEIVYFPAYGGGIDLLQNTSTPELLAEEDFSFECAMSMLHGYVKVVEDLDNVDMNEVKAAVESFTPTSEGCCN